MRHLFSVFTTLILTEVTLVLPLNEREIDKKVYCNTMIASKVNNDGLFLLQTSSKWLQPSHIEYILLNYNDLGFILQSAPAIHPQSGQIFIFNRENTKKFKHDRINWIKRKGLNRVQETYQSIKVNGIEKIQGVYCRSADNPNFQRRIYRLASEKSSLVLVHYRDCADSDTIGINHMNFEGNHQVSFKTESNISHFKQKESTYSSDYFNDEEFSLSLSDMESLSSSAMNCIDDFLEPLFDPKPDNGMSPLHGDPLRADSVVLDPDLQPICTILDFAPCCGPAHGGSKVLLCLSTPLQPPVAGWRIQVSFGDQAEDAELLQGGTAVRVRCSPALPPGSVRLRLELVSDTGGLVSPLSWPSQELFQILSPIPDPSTAAAKTDEPVLGLRRKEERAEQGRGDKVRLVERSMPGQQLGSLEGLTDSYLLSVAEQLLAAEKDDVSLRCELDALDGHGYSLLQYSCMYNLLSVLPQLLDRGANPQQRSADGWTALQLAASAGHIEAVQHLLEHVGRDGQAAVEALVRQPGPNGADALVIAEEHLQVHQQLSQALRQQPLDGSALPIAFLQDLYSSLSLQDKCALALSLDQQGDSGGPDDLADGTLDLDVQSVSALSEGDRDSLHTALGLMGDSELLQVEREVRLIQNNVRGWLLRKNYTSLRAAAKTLQLAWRGRKRHMEPLPPSAPNPAEHTSLSDAVVPLQALTRGHIARRSFSKLRRQALASQLIQRKLLAWWQRHGKSS